MIKTKLSLISAVCAVLATIILVINTVYFDSSIVFAICMIIILLSNLSTIYDQTKKDNKRSK